MKDEITRELKDMVEEENAQLKTFSIFHRASKLPVDPFKWGEKGGGIKLGIDMSLDLEKFSERNYSYFYLLILRNEISFQNLLLWDTLLCTCVVYFLCEQTNHNSQNILNIIS